MECVVSFLLSSNIRSNICTASRYADTNVNMYVVIQANNQKFLLHTRHVDRRLRLQHLFSCFLSYPDKSVQYVDVGRILKLYYNLYSTYIVKWYRVFLKVWFAPDRKEKHCRKTIVLNSKTRFVLLAIQAQNTLIKSPYRYHAACWLQLPGYGFSPQHKV